jgi:hypothetical protein
VLSAPSASLGSRNAKHRSHTFSPSEQAVAHCAMNGRGLDGRLWEQAVQGRVYVLCDLAQINS